MSVVFFLFNSDEKKIKVLRHHVSAMQLNVNEKFANKICIIPPSDIAHLSVCDGCGMTLDKPTRAIKAGQGARLCSATCNAVYVRPARFSKSAPPMCRFDIYQTYTCCRLFRMCINRVSKRANSIFKLQKRKQIISTQKMCQFMRIQDSYTKRFAL